MIFKESSILVSSENYEIIAEDINAQGQEFIPLRSLIPILSKEQMFIILKEYQYYIWDRRTKFCGVCGAVTNQDVKDLCKVCPECKERFYPAQFPAVIVSIIKDDKILLAHNSNFPGNLHSVIAGFVDLGESLEDAVVREIREEVGLEVENIRYFSSQSWGFSSSLMIAFTADFKSGDIKIDDDEIDFADWFSCNNLPELPPVLSIGRMLIDQFVVDHNNE